MKKLFGCIAAAVFLAVSLVCFGLVEAAQVLNAEKAKQAGQLKNVEADAAALAGVRSSVSVDGNQGSAGAQAQGYSEEQCKADWDNNKGNCKGDFIDFATYHAYTKAQASGKVKVLGKKAS